MRTSIVQLLGVAGAILTVAALLKLAPAAAANAAQAQGGGTATQDVAVRTEWGDPDLQGIWTYAHDTPLQRSPRYGTREFFTDEERQQLDKERGAALSRDRRVDRGSELDVAGAYNAVFLTFRPTGRRTSLIVDPPDGRIPPLTPEAQKLFAAERAYRLALLQSTETCRTQSVACAGGKYDPTPSSRRAELPPQYNTRRMNRHDNPEDGGLSDRCLAAGLPEFGTAFGGSYRRIVQTPGGITMYYDVGQGQGFQRNIVMKGSPHLPSHVRQWFGDSRGRWEGDTLVIEVTNFSPKSDFDDFGGLGGPGARDQRRLVERWTRTGPTTLDYEVTIEDPTVWTRPWTVRQELTKQSDESNRIYYEPRCYEGNVSWPSLLRSARLAEEAYEEGRGPHPATKDNATDFVGVEVDPLFR
jgi:hypothetical protein